MRAMDVMTTDVITVDPDRTVQALATLLAERGISGVPVVDASGSLDAMKYADSSGLAKAVAENPATPACLVDRLAAQALGRVNSSGERAWVKDLKQSFTASGYRMKQLIRDIALSDALYTVSAPAPRSGNTQEFRQ